MSTSGAWGPSPHRLRAKFPLPVFPDSGGNRGPMWHHYAKIRLFTRKGADR